MPYCSYCGVEVDEKTVTCPLCGTDIPAASKEPPLFSGDFSRKDYPGSEHRLHYRRRPFSAHERRVVLWLFSFILLVPLTVVLVVNLYAQGRISWAFYPIVALAGTWAVVAITLYLRGFWRLFFSCLALALVLSFVFNALAGSLKTFLEWNLPIILMATVLTLACAYYGRITERLGANLAAVILWAISVLCIGLDAFIAYRIGFSGLLMGWSIILASALVPTGVLLMYIHHRFGRTFSIKRYFNA